MTIHTLDHGRYRIRAGAIAGQPVARAFLAGAGQGAGTVAECTGATTEAVIGALVAELDTRDRAQRQARRHVPRSDFHVPTVTEFRLALDAIPLGDADRAMLRAHARAGTDGLTPADLARTAGWRRFSATNAHYGKLGRRIAEWLNTAPPRSAMRDEDVWTGLLGEYLESPGGSGRFVWIMHPELREALGED